MCKFSPLGRTKRHPEGNYKRILPQKGLKVKSAEYLENMIEKVMY